MKTYLLRLTSDEEVRVEAEHIRFEPGFVVFWATGSGVRAWSSAHVYTVEEIPSDQP